MTWVRLDRKILPHTLANAQFCDAVMVVVSRKLGIKYRTNQVLNPGPVVCESITLSARPLLLPCALIGSPDYEVFMNLFLFFVEAETACKALNGRFFGGHIVQAHLYDQDMFEANDLSG